MSLKASSSSSHVFPSPQPFLFLLLFLPPLLPGPFFPDYVSPFSRIGVKESRNSNFKKPNFYWRAVAEPAFLGQGSQFDNGDGNLGCPKKGLLEWALLPSTLLDRNIQFPEEVSWGFRSLSAYFCAREGYLGLVISSVYLPSLLFQSTFEMVHHAYCASTIYPKNQMRTFLDLV